MKSIDTTKDKDIRTISDFFDNEYIDYSNEVISNRAIPSVIDGFKPTQRKIIYSADKIWKGNSTDKFLKVFQFCGRCADMSAYAHGDASLSSAIINMNQTFKNNLPLLEGDGQYGSLRSPNAGAPRYVGTRLSPNFRVLYKDFELLENKIEEGFSVEPEYFLPIIPMVIVNHSEGMAIGFASYIFGRNPKEVTQSCIDYLSGKKLKELKPQIPEFTGTFIADKDIKGKWWIKGKYEIINSNTVKVTEIPSDWTFEKYESFLESLIDKKKIVDYDNNSAANIEYIIKFKREDLKSLIDSNKLESFLKIVSTETENLTVLDENRKLKIFENVNDIIKYFVDFRIKWVEKRKEFIINKINTSLNLNDNKLKFIKGVIDGTIKVNNVKKELIEKVLDKMKFDKIENSYNYLFRMPISQLSKEEFEKLKEENNTLKAELKEIKLKTPKEMYLNDLNELKKKL